MVTGKAIATSGSLADTIKAKWLKAMLMRFLGLAGGLTTYPGPTLAGTYPRLIKALRL